MQRRVVLMAASVVLAVGLLLPAVAAAQTGTIAGQVEDETGGVLPGVMVEATSPALIEGVRTSFSDGSGLYAIEALRPGTYTVTFTLGGFSTFVREGIEIATGFAANVDATLAVGIGRGDSGRSPGRARSSTCRTSSTRRTSRARRSTGCQQAGPIQDTPR